MRFSQYTHQKAEYDAHRDAVARAWFWQMRTGKSKQAIDNACYLEGAGEIQGVVLLAPNGVHLNWLIKELPAHHWDDAYNAFAWEFSNPDNAERFEWFLSECEFSASNWLAINLESVTRPEVLKAYKRFKRLCPDFMLICDESHHFRRPGAKRTARARSWARHAKYRRILTGTSCDNSPLHAFSQYELLEKAALGFARADEFQDHFAVYKQERMRNGRTFPRLDHYRNLEELKELMAPYTSVVLREDCEDMPEVIRDVRYVPLSDAQLKAHRAIAQNLIEETEELGLYDPLVGGAKMLKLQQVLSGFVYGDDKSPTFLGKTNPRLEAALDEIRQHDGKVIVWSRFTQDIVSLREALADEGIGTVEYHGKMSNSARVDSLKRFEKDAGATVMLGQPQSGGEGRDMSAASKIIWYSHTPDNIVRSQADERATAIGGEHVQLIDIAVPNSVDTYFLELLAEKRTLADDISRYGLREILKRINV